MRTSGGIRARAAAGRNPDALGGGNPDALGDGSTPRPSEGDSYERRGLETDGVDPPIEGMRPGAWRRASCWWSEEGETPSHNRWGDLGNGTDNRSGVGRVKFLKIVTIVNHEWVTVSSGKGEERPKSTRIKGRRRVIIEPIRLVDVPRERG